MLHRIVMLLLQPPTPSSGVRRGVVCAAQAKFYAVQVGRKCGVFTSWADGAKEAVDGFSGAKYKSFGSRAEAQAWIKNGKEPTARQGPSASNGSSGG